MNVPMERTLGSSIGHPTVRRLLDAIGSALHRLADRCRVLQPPTVVVVLSALLLTDSAFILAHALHKLWPFFADGAFALETERGYPEVFQYLKFASVIAMTGTLWSKTREPVYGAWMLLFAYMLCDDAFQVHERLGAFVAAQWHYRSAVGLRARDFGELTVTCAAATALLPLILLAHARGGRRAQDDSRGLALCAAGLVFFGVVLDMAHVVADGAGRYVSGVLGVLEDGGEMVVVSLLCWYASSLLPHRRVANRRRRDAALDGAAAFPGPQTGQNISRHV